MTGIKSFLARRLKTWWEMEWMPWLDWIQIEITSRCNAACIYCPRTAYRSQWNDRDMPLDLFSSLVPVFGKTTMVHLQGWGEPLLHENFFEMVSIAKKSGARVGTTTNGMLLDEDTVSRLISSGIDHVALSLAGTEETNDNIRKGTRVLQVLEAIAGLDAARKARRAEKPDINVAYLLLRSQLANVDRIIPMLNGRGVNNLVISTLDFVPAPELEEERIVCRDASEYAQLKQSLDRVSTEGRRAGIAVHYQLQSPDSGGRTCAENIERALFIAADGAVSPCPFTNLPVTGASHIADGSRQGYSRTEFGSIRDKSVPVIWMGQHYSEFRNSFPESPGTFCRQCPKRLIL